MTIPALPALNRASPTFRADLDGYFLTNLPATTGAINAALAGIEADITQSETARDAAQGSAAAAQTERIEAQAARVAAQASAAKVLSDGAAAVAAAQAANSSFKGAWTTLSGALAKPASVFHLRAYWVLLETVGDVAANEPGVSAAWAKTSAIPPMLAYSERGQLRSFGGATGDLALVDGLGLFALDAVSDEPDDDESCFVCASGRWLLQAASWDLIDAWQLPEVEERDAYDEDEPLRFASSFETSFPSSFAAAFASSFPASFSGKVLTGTATCAIASIVPTASASFTGTVAGASVGDRVIATPPGQLGGSSGETACLSYHAWVSAANTVTVMLTNSSASNTTNTNAAIRAAWPITVIKS